MKAYAVLDCEGASLGNEYVIAVFDDFGNARECVIHAVDSRAFDEEYIYIESYDVETGKVDRVWIYEELVIEEF